MAQSTGAAEYTDRISGEESDSPNECPGYDTKLSNDEAQWLWGMPSTSSHAIAPR